MTDSPIGAPAQDLTTPEFLPVRMLNEFVYCPRLFWLEWRDSEFAHSADTLEGRSVHRRVDQEGGTLPAVGEEPDPDRPRVARSVMISNRDLGLVARIDLCESDGQTVTPIDYKKGVLPEHGPWDPELIQVAAQVLLLRAEGYHCPGGALWFAGSRRRFNVDVDAALEARVHEFTRAARSLLAGAEIPPPLIDSPKCVRCSLVSICLPDEINYLTGRQADEPRRLMPARDDARPLHVISQGAKVGINAERIRVTSLDGKKDERRLLDLSQLCLYGNVGVSAQALKALSDHEVPVLHMSSGGWLRAFTTGIPHKNIQLRIDQHEVARDPSRSLAIAKSFVTTKIRNQRTLLRRNGGDAVAHLIRDMETEAENAERAKSAESLLGTEGLAARHYFAGFPSLLKPLEDLAAFNFEGRNRRPPKDPVNAMLSFAYALLVRELTTVLWAVGFDPFLGFFHRPRYGRPALALDLAEEFRPILAESVVINAINNGEIKSKDFVHRGIGVNLNDTGRKKFIESWERRLDTLIRHPNLTYAASYRRIFEIQARLLARHVQGELPHYPGFRTR